MSTHFRSDSPEETAQEQGGSNLPSTGYLLIATAEGVSVARALPTHGRFVLGRGGDVDIAIAHPSVSRRHAVLALGDRVTVEDLGSKNGVRVGGVPTVPGHPAVVLGGALWHVGSALLTLQRLDAQSAGILSADPGPTSPLPSTVRTADHAVVIGGNFGQMVRLIDRIANSTIGVLILGETGVGKDVVAELVHFRSRRASGPFVRVHCAAITESLFESELFGHERGAFTGANVARKGLLESAHGGTVFLDEVGEMSRAMQVKLLRVIEDRRVTRVGSVESRKVDTRFVAATNRNLEQPAASGEFRQDLYFRLGGIVLPIAPLRDRRDEIEPLARSFLERTCAEQGLELPVLSNEAVRLLKTHAYPGNVRELRGMIERAVLLAPDGIILPEHLVIAPQAQSRGNAVEPELASRSPEARRVVDALSKCAGNQTEAARLLGVSRRTLIKKLIAHGIPRPRKGP